jgi:hypothetical protein
MTEQLADAASCTHLEALLLPPIPHSDGGIPAACNRHSTGHVDSLVGNTIELDCARLPGRYV